MLPPILETVKSYPPAVALLGSDPTRFFAFGTSPQDMTKPYAVWQVPNAYPENYLGSLSDMDDVNIQVDCYSKTSQAEAVSIGTAIRAAVERQANVTTWRTLGQDNETKLWRFVLLIEWLNPRTSA